MSRVPRSTILSAVLSACEAAGETPAIVETSALEALTRKPVYAIPEWLVDGLINPANKCRELFTSTEIDLERRFSRLCQRFGIVAIFHCKFASHLLLSQPASLTEESFREKGFHHLLSYATFQSRSSRWQRLVDPVHGQLEGYLGWLMTWRPFLAERDALQAKWREAIDLMGLIPKRPVVAHVEFAASALEIDFERDELIEDFTRFYAKWKLNALTTWHLPEPVGANLGTPALAGKLVGVEEQPALQLPATIQLPGTYPTRELASDPQDHLADWHKVLEERHPDGLGFERFRRVFQSHFWRNIVLASSYDDRFHSKSRMSQLDSIFASHSNEQSNESWRKIRFYIRSRLKAHASS